QVYFLLKRNGIFSRVKPEVISYFERVWVGRYDEHGEYRNPLYTPSMWSIFSSFSDEEIDATTSVLEAFHRGWSSWVENRPRFENFVEYIRDQQYKAEGHIAQANRQDLGKLKKQFIRPL